jgi:hypothetical protein
MGYQITQGGKIVISIDYNPFFTITSGTPTFTFPDSYFPIASDVNLKLCSCEINVKSFGCISNAKELEGLWKEFQMKGIPLDKMAESFLVYDVNSFCNGTIPLPSIIELVILIDSINSVKNIKGVHLRITKLKKELSAITDKQIYFDKQRNNETQEYNSYCKNCEDLLETILSAINEFQVAIAIKKSFPELEFTDDKGKSDLVIRKKNLNIDAKIRLPKINLTTNSDKSVELSPKALLALLCKDGFPQIANAFDEQLAEIVVVNLTTTQYGFLLSTESTSLGNQFESSLNEAIRMVEDGKQVVIVYSKTRGDIIDIYSTALERGKIELIGANIDKIDKIFKRNLKPLDFFDLARLVNGLTKDDLKVKDNSMMSHS